MTDPDTPPAPPAGRGGPRGGGRPTIPDAEKRQPIRTNVAPETLAAIEAFRKRRAAAKLSIGDVIDRAVAATIREDGTLRTEGEGTEPEKSGVNLD